MKTLEDYLDKLAWEGLRKRFSEGDGLHIRAAALAHLVPCLTTVAAARAAAAGIADWISHPLSVRSLQEYHREMIR